jgi:hypothetical protein
MRMRAMMSLAVMPWVYAFKAVQGKVAAGAHRRTQQSRGARPACKTKRYPDCSMHMLSPNPLDSRCQLPARCMARRLCHTWK